MKYQFRKPEECTVLSGHLKLGGSNPEGEKIEVNNIHLIKNGKPWLPVMGEFHFSRYNKEEWYREVCKMKAGGITIVATYLFWIHHEETEGVYDFSGNKDLRSFVLACRKAGLKVLVRIGPWSHGECRNGGFPDWLQRKPFALRSNDPAYLACVHRWFEQVGKQLQGLYYKDGGNIIGVQLENEFSGEPQHYIELKKIAKECGIDVPIYTVTGWSKPEGTHMPLEGFIPVFGAYCDYPWEATTEKIEPDVNFFFSTERNDGAIGTDLLPLEISSDWKLPYERFPFITCELGGGLQCTHHRRYIVDPMDIYAVALVKLAGGNNLPGYYVYHGGSNPIGKISTTQESKATGYPNDYPILSYDYIAPLSEYGEVRGQYGLLNLMHLFLQDFEESFAPLQAVQAKEYVGRHDFSSLRYGMRSDGHRGYVFVNHHHHRSPIADIKDAEIDTGSVVFPPIDVCGKISFFLPFMMDLDHAVLEYATAQPICRAGDTFFFVEIPGIPARYKLAGGKEITVPSGMEPVLIGGKVKIVTLPWEKAQYLRRLDGTLYIGENCNLYRYDGKLEAVEPGEFHACRFNSDGTWEKITVGKPAAPLHVVWEELQEAPFVPPYEEELQIGGKRKLTWKKLSVEGTEGFVSIDDRYDAAQIYADGKLVADNYYYGMPWRVPASMLAGKECYMVSSEMKDDFYREF